MIFTAGSIGNRVIEDLWPRTVVFNSLEQSTSINEEELYQGLVILATGAKGGLYRTDRPKLTGIQEGAYRFAFVTATDPLTYVGIGLADEALRGATYADDVDDAARFWNQRFSQQPGTPFREQNGRLVFNSVYDDVASPIVRDEMALQRLLASKGNSSPKELVSTHRIDVRRGAAKKEFDALKADIKANGIQQPILFVEHGGKKYVVDGHHRVRAALELGLKDVPVQQVELPFGGYKTPHDLLDYFNN